MMIYISCSVYLFKTCEVMQIVCVCVFQVEWTGCVMVNNMQSDAESVCVCVFPVEWTGCVTVNNMQSDADSVCVCVCVCVCVSGGVDWLCNGE